MSDFSRLEHVAELVIRRVILEVGRTKELPEALERAYPFGDVAGGREAWDRAVGRVFSEGVKEDPDISTDDVQDFRRGSQRTCQSRSKRSPRLTQDHSG
jgi:hypothetical protein